MDTEKTQFGNGHPEEKKPIIVYQLPAPGISDAGKKCKRPRVTMEICSGSRPATTSTSLRRARDNHDQAED
jgi:hypothetical protein